MKKKTLSDKSFLRIVNSNSTFIISVKGNQCLEETLEQIISESLKDSSIIDIKRIPFGLKVDIAIALGSIDKSLRSPLKKINSFRNKYAHDRVARLNKKEISQLLNALPLKDKEYIVKRDGPNASLQQFLKGSIFVLYATLTSSYKSIKENKIRAKVLNEMADEYLKDAWKGKEDDLEKRRQKTEAEILKRIKELSHNTDSDEKK
jgi:hypothetical protein